MTSDHAYVWIWLPGATQPVVAGEVRRAGALITFRYGRSYLDRSDAVSLYAPELPLRQGWLEPPTGLTMASCLRDGLPDAWGQRVILARLTGAHGTLADTAALDEFTYMLESGSDRFGALDFQPEAVSYRPRMDSATLDELHRAAQLLLEGRSPGVHLEQALIHGTSIGGARPKVLVAADGVDFIAKLSRSDDHYPVVRAEAAALELARMAGVRVPGHRLTSSLGRDVLLIERFDRSAGGQRRSVVSGLTMLGLDELIGRYATYPGLLDVLLEYADTAPGVARELFERIAFNIVIGNNDDHARNHAAFWDGAHLALTPAYDLCPQRSSGFEANQAMAYGRRGERAATLAGLVGVAAVYGLTRAEARGTVDRIVSAVDAGWTEASDRAELTESERQILWRRMVLNPGVLDGLR